MSRQRADCRGWHTFASSQVQGSIAVGVLHIDVGMGCKQCLHRRLKAAACCIVQRCCPVLSLQVRKRLSRDFLLISIPQYPSSASHTNWPRSSQGYLPVCKAALQSSDTHLTWMSTSALASIRASTMARWPAVAAACRAVAPPPAATRGSAEDASKCFTACAHSVGLSTASQSDRPVNGSPLQRRQ